MVEGPAVGTRNQERFEKKKMKNGEQCEQTTDEIDMEYLRSEHEVPQR